MKYVWFYHGKRYEMTDEQLEAAYRFRKRQYKMVDAKNQLVEFIYGDDPSTMSDFDIQYQEQDFLERYHMTPVEAFAKLEKIVSRFEKDADSNLDENSRWRNAIQNVLTGT